MTGPEDLIAILENSAGMVSDPDVKADVIRRIGSIAAAIRGLQEKSPDLALELSRILTASSAPQHIPGLRPYHLSVCAKCCDQEERRASAGCWESGNQDIVIPVGHYPEDLETALLETWGEPAGPANVEIIPGPDANPDIVEAIFSVIQGQDSPEVREFTGAMAVAIAQRATFSMQDERNPLRVLTHPDGAIEQWTAEQPDDKHPADIILTSSPGGVRIRLRILAAVVPDPDAQDRDDSEGNATR
jgi:hypothetical protein